MNMDRFERLAERPRLARLGRRWNVLVVIPAHNEESLIESSVRSVSGAVAHAGERVASSLIVVVADRCSDATVSRVHTCGVTGRVHVVEVVAGNVGAARRIGVQTAVGLTPQCDPSRTWVANTDADTVVPSDWLTRQLDFADRGVVGVAGVVEIDDFSELAPAARECFATSYTKQLPTAGDHGHVHAANLGIRLDAYCAAGGWSPLPRSEDRDLWRRIGDLGAHLVAPTHVKVLTSGRAFGRVPGGFADCLREQAASFIEPVAVDG